MPTHRHNAAVPGTFVEGANEVHCGPGQYHWKNQYGAGCTNKRLDKRHLGCGGYAGPNETIPPGCKRHKYTGHGPILSRSPTFGSRFDSPIRSRYNIPVRPIQNNPLPKNFDGLSNISPRYNRSILPIQNNPLPKRYDGLSNKSPKDIKFNTYDQPMPRYIGSMEDVYDGRRSKYVPRRQEPTPEQLARYERARIIFKQEFDRALRERYGWEPKSERERNKLINQ